MCNADLPHRTFFPIPTAALSAMFSIFVFCVSEEHYELLLSIYVNITHYNFSQQVAHRFACYQDL